MNDAAPPPDPAVEVQRRIAPIVGWLMEERLLRSPTTILLDRFCRELSAAGIPLWRVSLSIGQLHPQFRARTLLWDAESGGAVEVGRQHGIETTEVYLDSPVRRIHEGAPAIRRRLAQPDCPLDFPILKELKERGCTDYTILPIYFSGRRTQAISCASREPHGFAELDLAVFEAVLPAFGAILELYDLRRTARGLLETYLGPTTGERVLAGSIRRGDGKVIHAVLWFCDLRDYTAHSEILPLESVIARLNDYFDDVAGPLQSHGGEILKFIGDGLLAIFPIEGGAEDTGRACTAALAAAREALDGLAPGGAPSGKSGVPAIRFGIALHVGDVLYGNVGAASRLDFTVIGPAVNLVTRLESLSKDLDPPLILSADFAAAAGLPVRSLGRHALKGIAEAQEAFTPA